MPTDKTYDDFIHYLLNTNLLGFVVELSTKSAVQM